MTTHKSLSGKKMKLTDAAAFLGVSSASMSRLIKNGHLKHAVDPLDRRRKLVAVKELERLKRESLNGE